MEVLRDGTFVFTIDSTKLNKGLRPSSKVPRNTKYLVECVGAIGIDGVLQVIEDLELSRIDTSLTISDAFPYPQIFVFNKMILICDSTHIYEYAGGSLTSVIGPVAVGGLWSMIDFYNFIYATNGVVAVIRSPTSTVWALTTDYPISHSVCEYNGQVILGGLTE